MRIGITLTSSLSVGQEYINLTRKVAERLAGEEMGIVYSGTDYGMMSELAKVYKDAGGSDLTGVMAKGLMAVTKSLTPPTFPSIFLFSVLSAHIKNFILKLLN